MPTPFHKLIETLDGYYSEFGDLALSDPFELIVYTYIAYLADDEKRNRAFQLLSNTVGLQPQSILNATLDELIAIAKTGGIHQEERARRIRLAAEIVLEDFEGDLKGVLKRPIRDAKRELMRFPYIGEPGAEKILLFTYSAPILALESNGLRVLLRVGFGEERKSYSSSYRSVQNSIQLEPLDTCEWIINAYRLLRLHGKELCKTNGPACQICPVKRGCEYNISNSRRG